MEIASQAVALTTVWLTFPERCESLVLTVSLWMGVGGPDLLVIISHTHRQRLVKILLPFWICWMREM